MKPVFKSGNCHYREDGNNLFSMLTVGCPLQTDNEDADFVDHNPQDCRDRSPEVFFL